MIEGVILKDLVVHKDERGELFEILRSDEKIFNKFGQAYITVCYPGWVKGWHYHKLQADSFCTVRGKSKIVLCDKRNNSKTYGLVEEYVLDAEKPQLLRIPCGVIHGFECIGDGECWILNLPTETYNRKEPDEHRFPLNSPEVPYEPWKGKKGH
jgi:dTDP-4-dehydrorhamnose 3,5-epimerase